MDEPKIMTVTTRIVKAHIILEMTFRLNQDMKAGDEVTLLQEVTTEGQDE